MRQLLALHFGMSGIPPAAKRRKAHRLLDLPIPVIGVANGPATIHSEYLLLSDIHIASERATYADFPHTAFGIAGGDGVHVVWEEIVGVASHQPGELNRRA